MPGLFSRLPLALPPSNVVSGPTCHSIFEFDVSVGLSAVACGQAGRRLLPSLVWSSDSHYALRDVDRAGRVKEEAAEKKEGEERGEQQQQAAAAGPNVLDAAARAASRTANTRCGGLAVAGSVVCVRWLCPLQPFG